MPKPIVAAWVVAFVVNLAFWGFVAWVGFKLVDHFVG